jgi:hypothetical protein
VVRIERFCLLKIDETVKSRNPSLPVMPAEAGIQCFQQVMDPGFRRDDEKVTFYMSIKFEIIK